MNKKIKKIIKEKNKKENHSRIKIGSTGQKILLLLVAGVALGLSGRPGRYFRVLKLAQKEWKKINQAKSRNLHMAIKKLYRSKMINWRENNDGTVTIVLSKNGKNRALQYNLDNMKIKKPVKWDGLWRVVIFDVPERLRQGRNALVEKLKKLGFFTLQKSVFIYPYECKNEIDYIVEIFNLGRYVNFMIVKEIDINSELKNKFKIK
ncbi:MAG: hypothetical protein COU40_01500 [Candidatus Moranbacteria bacterium CG10_big_fil_rev_8_21_14_0_10_35_21]|nr:MAG: hypothetical protein COU40_01500 [Candidatus Moranbacteria bacterium CG10_big_fil_rev_8_21_14_0_10_35_21]PJA88721.1 MAG: hypothetical protein CO139_01560 [Candidatus Moranbacteria bacterium CG_4_9_14_3_um_filter_36_9]